MEKYLQFQDSVPCKIRAKRGCATHPRSIAERVRFILCHLINLIILVIDILLKQYKYLSFYGECISSTAVSMINCKGNAFRLEEPGLANECENSKSLSQTWTR